MASHGNSKVLQRDLEPKVNENRTVRNKFRWDWLDKKVDGVRVGDVIRKIDVDGSVKCCCSDKLVHYGTSGFKAVRKHMLTSFLQS